MHTSIKGIETPTLMNEIAQCGYEPYRARQIARWVYRVKEFKSFEDMTDLPLELRRHLTERYFIDSLTIKEVRKSADGTQKILFGLRDGQCIESVLMPDNKEKNRFTLCVSTQVGCPLKCAFCVTGTIGFIRNLRAEEIIDQVLIARRELVGEEQLLRNLVFMGMGEPLLNTGEVIKALNFIVAPQYCGFSPRRVTISTVGILPGLKKLAAANLDVNLAISLNATTNELRTRLMPINAKYPIESILAACMEFPVPRRRRITFEYVMLKDVNDSIKEAHELARLLCPLRCKINLIVFNPSDEIPFEGSTPERIEQFRQALLEKNYTVAIRYSKGRDIQAACGQLAAEKRSSNP